ISLPPVDAPVRSVRGAPPEDVRGSDAGWVTAVTVVVPRASTTRAVERHTVAGTAAARPASRGRHAADAPGSGSSEAKTVTGEEYSRNDAVAAFRRSPARRSPPPALDGPAAHIQSR